MTKRLIVVAGNIGAGKTSLTQCLGERLGWDTGFESVTDNPYLADFYEDMAAWSFHLQVFHLGHRSNQLQAAADAPGSNILDRSLYEDYEIFTKALHKLGNISDRDFLAYEQVYDLVVKGLPAPDLLLYLKCPVEVLLERIRQRGRDIETGITLDYLNLLESLYEDWMSHYELSPVLTIPTDDLNFVERASHLDIVIERIQHTLAGKEDVVFPN
ncbi:MAG: deoxynucleoside kinase [Chloroflexi bacterium]|nr:MAG: deoxynucleoside kinase [Chloroflexota bacterium]MBL1195992.1 deoxynucleoside kinase [Chloroflexota bacterium]NOH13286.1 deoxynucleoside kinase [Chloroflexota bacterium]